MEGAGGGGGGWLGAGQEVVAKSPLTSDWHAPEPGRAVMIVERAHARARARAVIRHGTI